MIKLICAWIGHEIRRDIKAEYHYSIGVSTLIFLSVLVFMVEMANHDYDALYSKMNHVEYRMNDYDKNIKDMTVIKQGV